MIAKGDDEGREEIELYIDQIINRYRERLTTPICAFITFTTQEARERFGRYNCKTRFSGNKNLDYKAYTLLEEEAEISFCNEPSDIIWENLEVSNSRRKAKKFAAGNIILAFLAITTVIFYFLRLEAGSFVDKFPSSTPCYSFDSTFTESD